MRNVIIKSLYIAFGILGVVFAADAPKADSIGKKEPIVASPKVNIAVNGAQGKEKATLRSKARQKRLDENRKRHEEAVVQMKAEMKLHRDSMDASRTEPVETQKNKARHRKLSEEKVSPDKNGGT